MERKTIQIRIQRFDPNVDQKPYISTYTIPHMMSMNVLDAFDYIFENIDSSLAYFKHVECHQGVCKRCGVKVNGKPSLACATSVEDKMEITPINNNIIRDLFVASKPKQ